jgi:hypothetical protein
LLEFRKIGLYHSSITYVSGAMVMGEDTAAQSLPVVEHEPASALLVGCYAAPEPGIKEQSPAVGHTSENIGPKTMPDIDSALVSISETQELAGDAGWVPGTHDQEAEVRLVRLSYTIIVLKLTLKIQEFGESDSAFGGDDRSRC